MKKEVSIFLVFLIVVSGTYVYLKLDTFKSTYEEVNSCLSQYEAPTFDCIHPLSRKLILSGNSKYPVKVKK